ncbi:diguanylate cyclase [Caldimonas sp. KR1-144]|uniref:GGDEF domain-containing protein n=1 Tax=Caldimonas sp. KR1-144 TaxID=3400911 RepID=UPI003C107CCE
MSRLMRGFVAGALALGLVLGTGVVVSQQAPSSGGPGGSAVVAAIDAAAAQGWQQPELAEVRLRGLAVEGELAQQVLAAWQLDALYARRGDGEASRALIDRLERGAPLQRAVAGLLRARRARDASAPDLALRDGQAALKSLHAALAGAPSNALDDALLADAHRLVGNLVASGNDFEGAMRELQTARRLAQARGDAAREALALADQAQLQAAYGQADIAVETQAEARRAAGSLPQPALQAQLRLGEALLWLPHGRGHDGAARALSAADAALALAADAPVLAAQAQALRSHALRHLGRAGEAKQAAQAAERQLGAAGIAPRTALARTVRAEAGLAAIALGQQASGRAEVEAAIAPQGQPAAAADALAEQLLRELGVALRAAGDAPAALEAYHRERALVEQRMARERAAVTSELETRYERVRQQSELELLERRNALQARELEAAQLKQRGMVFAALAVALGLAALALLYRRVRGVQRQLAARQARLRDLSERDPLTGLANRRHCQAVLGRGGYEGALCLIDVDHFKRINDSHGHAAGDQVLVEAAQRMTQTVRESDLAVRWGGEEFLVAAPGLPAGQAGVLAERLLQALAGKPVTLPDGSPWPLTVSIGYVELPLAGTVPALGWERALGLVDRALYAAKHGGRNQAVGVAMLRADDEAMLAALEDDLDAARAAGRLQLRVHAGPTH